MNGPLFMSFQLRDPAKRTKLPRSIQEVISDWPLAISRGVVEESRVAKLTAKRTQFLLAALASYIAVSAQAISCCGEEACLGKVATPKLAVSERVKRRPPLK